MAGTSLAQSTYTSPYVYAGKSFELAIPKGFHQIESEDDGPMIGFCTNPDAPIYDKPPKGEDAIMILYDYNWGDEPESLESLRDDMMENTDGGEFVETPEIKTINGQKFLLGQMVLNDDDWEIKGYIMITHFGQFQIITMMALDAPKPSYNSLKDFEKFVGGFNIVETDRENEFNYFDDWADDMDFEMHYQNSMFETQFTYSDAFFFPGDEDSWEEVSPGDSILLLEYEHMSGYGSVKLFSGGFSTNYTSDRAKQDAVAKILAADGVWTLEKKADVEGENHNLVRYSMTKKGARPIEVYAFESQNETVFVVAVPTGENDVEFFSDAYDLARSVWIMDMSDEFEAYPEGESPEEYIDEDE